MPKHELRPQEVTPENWPRVCNYYKGLEPNKFALHALHLATSVAYWPRTHYEGNSKERITELLDTKHRLFVVCNHVNILDQLAVASLMQRGPLRDVIGNTTTLAKQPYFDGDRYRDRLMRRCLEAVGSIPVCRDKDLEGFDLKEKLQIANATFDVVATQAEHGRHNFSFPESTRNRDDPSKLLKIKSGLGRITMEAAGRGVPVAIAPVVLWYGEGKNHSFRPHVFVAEPIEPPFASAQQITREVQESMGAGLEYLQNAA